MSDTDHERVVYRPIKGAVPFLDQMRNNPPGSGILRAGMSPKQGRNTPALVENLSPKQGRNTPALVEGQLQNSMSQRLSHPRPSQEWNSDMHGTQSNVTVRCTHTEFPVRCTF